ncbi:ribosomal RNA small subunit methyltransferase G [Kushneria pakistanensis]|uniref:Ribosomal RNA small subunit methyltransferase G n=1 Tax=Kushneria pakistanensis TaxID=1508770 RepID=A0ABQ3FFZ1_9GAMM|nr:16S rRNA (guanine(527)-N(7))-methyltransferase RsmG [Kushneria pakistanensis]GHC22430.1 ribosomal RNA small subunit methyltransferase G [Kushneria pakistanensis]
MSEGIERRLDDGMAALQTDVSEEVRERLLAFVTLLHKWNRAYNLTAVRDIETMVTRHLLDSLAILPWIEGPGLLDVGSGAGLPGIVIAIVRPDIALTSIDSNGKKIRFQRQVAFELGLDNVTPVHDRVEALSGVAFEQITSRAFAAPEAFVTLTRSLLAENGHWLAMAGRVDDITLPQDVRLVQTWPLDIPGEQAQRHLLKMDIA